MILYLCKPQAFPPVYLNSSPLEARFYHQGLKIDLWANANYSVLISMLSTFFLVSDFFFFFFCPTSITNSTNLPTLKKFYILCIFRLYPPQEL